MSGVFNSVWNISGLLILPLTSSSLGTSVALALPPASRTLPMGQPCRTTNIWSGRASLLIWQITIRVLSFLLSVNFPGLSKNSPSAHVNTVVLKGRLVWNWFMVQVSHLSLLANVWAVWQSVWTDFLTCTLIVQYIFTMWSRWLVVFLVRRNQAAPLNAPLYRYHLRTSPQTWQQQWCWQGVQKHTVQF